MKKIITLLLAVGAAGSVFAQSTRDRAADVILKGGRNTSGNYPTTQYPSTQYPSGSQQNEINAINRDYDAQVAAVRNNPTLSNEEKDRRIQVLERERARRIREVNRRYGQRDDRNDRDDDRYEKNKNKRNGKDNGNHYGWQKGKGNPHRDGNWQPGNGNGKGKGKKDKGGDD